MERFALFKSDRETFIVCSNAPFYYAEVLKFDSDLEYATYTNTCNHTLYAQVFPYRILVVFKSSLGGRVHVQHHITLHLRELVAKMAEYYKEISIKPYCSQYEKYLF